jgi:hypothetical protein
MRCVCGFGQLLCAFDGFGSSLQLLFVSWHLP